MKNFKFSAHLRPLLHQASLKQDVGDTRCLERRLKYWKKKLQRDIYA